ncbi:muellerian-inhibiting factor [Xyrichtys novacula]|uniref:Muellerian-inhibiting factor n=1 Tax=Xyrichtys novacula TaxID=13765 RepID=A0AAV1FFZ8_XYRNO|nr:muellerian-inhibiting factor [Xyrichtys novacula]
MLVVDFLVCGALMLCCARMCVALSLPHDPSITGGKPTTATTGTGNGPQVSNAAHTLSAKTSYSSAASQHLPNLPPCLVDDVFAALHESVANNNQLTNQALALFGICAASENSSASVLADIAKESNSQQGHGLRVFHLSGGLLSEGDEEEPLELTFDLSHLHLPVSKPVMLLALESLPPGENMEVTLTSHILDPSTQTVCISAETQYIMLAGKESAGKVHHKWRISAETNSPAMKKKLKGIFVGKESGSNISVTSLLLFSGERGTEIRHTHVLGSSLTSTFLCELRRFLGDALPQSHPRPHHLQLDSLQSLPPLTLGLSSSETLLAGLINSSALTIFSFSSWGSKFQGYHGELSLSPQLLEELRQRLEQTVEQIVAVMREEDVGHRASERLGRLKELSVFPKTEPTSGEIQYCAFLLLKALQTVARAYEVEKRLRATRAGNSNSMGASVCALRSLTVSLERTLVGPNTANINNCHGSCAFPLVNANNHAILLNFHIENENTDERAPCCVPVAYEHLEVVDLNQHGTYLSIKPDVVAKECGCR